MALVFVTLMFYCWKPVNLKLIYSICISCGNFGKNTFGKNLFTSFVYFYLSIVHINSFLQTLSEPNLDSCAFG